MDKGKKNAHREKRNRWLTIDIKKLDTHTLEAAVAVETSKNESQQARRGGKQK